MIVWDTEICPARCMSYKKCAWLVQTHGLYLIFALEQTEKRYVYENAGSSFHEAYIGLRMNF